MRERWREGGREGERFFSLSLELLVYLALPFKSLPDLLSPAGKLSLALRSRSEIFSFMLDSMA